MIGAVHGVCVQLFNTVVFVCGRLFELDPALVSLFHYSPNCGSTQDCLSSPEFLEHVTKVRRLHHSDRYNHTHTHTPHTFLFCPVLFFLYLLHQVMLVIDAAVSHLDDLHSLEDFLFNLGKKHQAVGVNTQSFAVGSCISS